MPIADHTGVLIVDHGSRKAEANDMLAQVAAEFARHSGAAIVEHAHMELAEPTIAQGFDRCVARGARHVVASLYFLSPGRHSREDIPAMVAEAAAQHPGVTWSIAEPLGIDPRIAAVMQDRVAAALPQSGAQPHC